MTTAIGPASRPLTMLTVLTQKPAVAFGNVGGHVFQAAVGLLAVPANGIILRLAELEEKPWPKLAVLYLIQQSWPASP